MRKTAKSTDPASLAMMDQMCRSFRFRRLRSGQALDSWIEGLLQDKLGDEAGLEGRFVTQHLRQAFEFARRGDARECRRQFSAADTQIRTRFHRDKELWEIQNEIVGAKLDIESLGAEAALATHRSRGAFVLDDGNHVEKFRRLADALAAVHDWRRRRERAGLAPMRLPRKPCNLCGQYFFPGNAEDLFCSAGCARARNRLDKLGRTVEGVRAAIATMERRGLHSIEHAMLRIVRNGDSLEVVYPDDNRTSYASRSAWTQLDRDISEYFTRFPTEASEFVSFEVHVGDEAEMSYRASVIRGTRRSGRVLHVPRGYADYFWRIYSGSMFKLSERK